MRDPEQDSPEKILEDLTRLVLSGEPMPDTLPDTPEARKLLELLETLESV